MNIYYKKYSTAWVEAILLDKSVEYEFNEATLAVVRRKFANLLGTDVKNGMLECEGCFSHTGGETTVTDICQELENANTVIIDTSSYSGATEILLGSLIVSEVYRKYRKYKSQGVLDDKPVVTVVLEEAPRVLGKEVLERGPNIFGTIAREGRKFQVGLCAITQLPSLIPREVLANMNTKIILGIEMKPERQAIIESAAQDLSTDDRSIASLDKGEAIITSNFARFATPIKIPLFQPTKQEKRERPSFSGVNI